MHLFSFVGLRRLPQERQQALLRSFQERKSKVAEEWRQAEERAKQEEEEAARKSKKRADGDGFIDNAEVEQGEKPPPELDGRKRPGCLVVAVARCCVVLDWVVDGTRGGRTGG